MEPTTVWTAQNDRLTGVSAGPDPELDAVVALVGNARDVLAALRTALHRAPTTL